MPEPGDSIGPYRLIAVLGRGAMGEVWRARDERLDRYVALKVLPPDLAGDDERRARMLREARAAAAIRHANVVTLFDVVANGGDDILVMELVEGKTLAERLRTGPPPLEMAARWLSGIADALVAAHARGILHRDIKAANIMIASDGGVKVLDFGLAKLRDEIVATVPSPPTAVIARGSIDSYKTQAGELLGTPLYMAPEQISGEPPDERSEVFSFGVLAYELLAGRSPYTATTIDELFAQIAARDAVLPATVPPRLADVVHRALAKAPGDRWPDMAALRDAIDAARARVFARPRRRWPLVAGALAIAALASGGAALWWRTPAPPTERPGDAAVARALEEYDLFYGDKAMSSLRAALATAPDHPRAAAYTLLFGNASDADRDAALACAQRANARSDLDAKDRTLLDAAIALAERGPADARAVIATAVAPDRELAFWAAELDYRAGRYAESGAQYEALLADPSPQFRGRIYDHESSVLLYLDRPTEALQIGKLYRDAFAGEADAVGVYATTLAAAGRYHDAVAAAEDALRLSEGEDTLAGLAKVVALSGDHARAKELYQRSLDRAGSARRPIRRAALALLQWLDGDVASAIATTAPCLRGGADAAARERGACLFVAGVVDPAHADDISAQLDQLAAEATPLRPAYGAPATLAALVRARARSFGGACLVPADPPHPDPALDQAFAMPLDFYAAYHLPWFATWQACEHAAYLAARGDRAGAVATLVEVAARSPQRQWILTTLDHYK